MALLSFRIFPKRTACLKTLLFFCLQMAAIGQTACTPSQPPMQTAGSADETAACAEPQEAIDALYTESDSLEVVKLLKECPAETDNDVLYFARHFIGRPYVAHTLEGNAEERLVVNLRQLDCTTFVETVTALVMTRRQGKTSFLDFCNNLERIRYGKGGRNGYCSRLHYFGWWIQENERRGIVSIVGDAKLFTGRKQLNLSYMSQHPEKYEALRRSPSRRDSIYRLEQAYNGISFPYLPARLCCRPPQELQAIEPGDLIAITTSKKGLDYAHLGFATRDKEGCLHLLNASSIYKKVVDDGNTLCQYLKKHPSFTGITVLRIKKN